MSSRLTRAAYKRMVDENIAWLDKQPRTLERDHIRTVLERAVDYEYGPDHDGDDPAPFGRNCPEGMVQVEFVGCPPEARRGNYSWIPTKHAFLELWVDGRRFRVDLGTHHDGTAERRGLRIIGEIPLVMHQDSINAGSVYYEKAKAPAPVAPA